MNNYYWPLKNIKDPNPLYYMSNEKKILQGITNRPPLERADNEFLWNTGLQLSLSSGIFFLYIFLRPKVKWLYSPNIQGKRSHPCYNYTGY